MVLDFFCLKNMVDMWMFSSSAYEELSRVQERWVDAL